MAGFLWTREAVSELISQRHGLLLARTTVGGYLRGWGSAPSGRSGGPWSRTRWRLRAGRPDLSRDPAQARRDGGVVLWLDEMGVRSDAAAGRSWAPVGQTPVIRRTGKRFRVNMISAISNAGLLRFRLFVGSFAGAVFIDFLRRLLRDCAGRKVHLIVDGYPVHRSKLVSAWIGRHTDRVQLHFLPGYSPELNPVELLNHDVKANAAGRRRPRSVNELREELRGYLRRRQRHPKSWSASSSIQRLGTPPPHESHHLPAAVITSTPTVERDLGKRRSAQRLALDT